MNAVSQQDLADHVDGGLNVLHFGQMSPQTELERLASTHRKAVAKYEQRAADARKQMKANLATLEADKKAEIARHVAELAALNERIAEEKIRAEKDIAADNRLAASSRAALTMLDDAV